MEEFKTRNIIKLGLTSVLIYSIFNKTLALTSILLIWLNLEIQIENQFILYFLTFISGTISLSILILLYNLYLKKELFKRKLIYELIGLSMLLLILITGVMFLYPTFITDISIEDYNRHFLRNKIWFRNVDVVFQIVGLIIFIIKINSKVIRIAISSVLIYLIYKKLNMILMKLFLWLNVNLRIENEIVINMISFIIGLLALIILINSFNRFSQKKSFPKRIIYILIMISLIFSLFQFGITELFESFMKNIDLGKFDRIHSNQYSLSLNLNLIYPFIGLIYYLRKLKNNKSTLANTV
jgi:hypothetical protein